MEATDSSTSAAAPAPTTTQLDLSLERRIAGVLVPVFAIRAEDDLGIGDTAGLKGFIDWAADTGFRLVQILPINETGGDNSPYNAISSMALEPTTLAVTPAALPDLSAETFAAELAGVDLAALHAGPVQYSVVKPLKWKLLRAAFENFLLQVRRKTKRAARFVDFCESQRAWLDDYALFRALMDENGGTECWDRWPVESQTAERARAFPEPKAKRGQWSRGKWMDFYRYVQWIAYAQWEEVKRHATARGVALMGDIPFGVSYYSSDVWSRPWAFRLQWSGGAPPEPYFKDDPFTQKWGQNWGIPLYDWDEMRARDFAWWRQRVGGVRGVFHVFRIDHILGFYRIYGFPWRPERNAEFLPLDAEQAREKTGGPLPGFQPRDDESWNHKETNRREGEAYLRVVLEAAGDTALIGEDLGTVPDYVRPSLTHLGIAGFKIPIWEPDPYTGHQTLIRPEYYQRLSLATFGTHDHEPLCALWTRWERTLSGQQPGNRDEAERELHKLSDFADIPPAWRRRGFTPELHLRLLEALFRTNSWIAVAMITDLLGTADRFNVPGPPASNWSRRLALSVEGLRTDPKTAELAARVRELLQKTGR